MRFAKRGEPKAFQNDLHKHKHKIRNALDRNVKLA